MIIYRQKITKNYRKWLKKLSGKVLTDQEQGVNEAKRKLSDAQLEYASAKRRIERQRKIRH